MISVAEFATQLRLSPEDWSAAAERPYVVVDAGARPDGDDGTPSLGHTPIVVIAVGAAGEPPRWADLSLDDESAVGAITATIEASPIAATSLAVLLRQSGTGTLSDGLVRESAVYSLLQAGPEFSRWRALTPARPSPTPDPVLVDRKGDVLCVVLDRPSRHNAIDPALRDGLCEAFALAAADPSIERIEWRGNGPSFCSGGDLDTFGSFSDPASAHVIRLTRSPASSCLPIANRLEARVHGACLGGGIELAAFAHRVVAHPQTRFGLPEVRYGLMPGAGGTVSLPARIGRWRTLELALRPDPIDAETALAWGLIDAIDSLPRLLTVGTSRRRASSVAACRTI